MHHHGRKWFVISAATVLLTTGAAKILSSSFGSAKVLSVVDPLLGIAFGRLMLLVGGAEVLIGILCFSRRATPGVKLCLVAWIASGFLMYRIGLWCIGWHHPCACMGGLAAALHISDAGADRIMKWVLAYLLLGSVSLLVKHWRIGRVAVPPLFREERRQMSPDAKVGSS